MDFDPALLALVGPLATAIVAILAIGMNYRSSGRSIKKDIELKKWEKRTDAYSDLLNSIDRQDPRNAPSIEKFRSFGVNDSAPIMALDLTGDEWRAMDVKVRLYASANVATLFAIWKYYLADWTMARASLIINAGHWESSTSNEREAFEREVEVRGLLGRIRREIVLHVRNELDFRERPMPKIVYTGPDSLSITLKDDWVTSDLEAFVSHDSDSILELRRLEGGWSARTMLSTGLSAEDMITAQRLWPPQEE